MLAFAGCKDSKESGISASFESYGSDPALVSSESSSSSSSAAASNSAYTMIPQGEDITAPIWLKIPNRVTLEKGDTITIDRYLSYVDDRDSSVDLTVTGEYDMSVVGEYPVTVTITDDAGNSTSGSFTINVIEPVTETSPTTPEPTAEHKTISFSDFISMYGSDNVMLGLDVSKWQGDIDFNAVKAAGCDFVILRAMVYYEGELLEDSYFRTNLEQAKAAGLKVGVYIYTFGNTEEIIREHADKLAELLDGEELDFPIGYDWEEFGRFQQFGLSMIDLNNLFYAFADEMSKYGYDTMLYSSKYYLETLWHPMTYGVWLAHYTEQTSYEGDYIMWQVNAIGRIDGIEGDVDINVYYGAGE